MAAKQSSRTGVQSHVGRSLLVMALILIGLGVWAFFPGQQHAPRLGLDLRGGTQVILLPKAVQEGQSITDQQLEQTVSIIRQRVDGIGVAEAEVTVQGSGDNAAIVVAVPTSARSAWSSSSGAPHCWTSAPCGAWHRRVSRPRWTTPRPRPTTRPQHRLRP